MGGAEEEEDVVSPSPPPPPPSISSPEKRRKTRGTVREKGDPTDRPSDRLLRLGGAQPRTPDQTLRTETVWGRGGRKGGGKRGNVAE